MRVGGKRNKKEGGRRREVTHTPNRLVKGAVFLVGVIWPCCATTVHYIAFFPRVD